MEELIKQWTNIVVAIAAIAALIVSLVSLNFSRRAFRLSEKQERRREPRLVPHLVDSNFEDFAEGGRVYSFLLLVANPMDADNALARIDMHLRYIVAGATLITVKLPSNNVPNSADDRRPRLAVPSRVAAHDTVSGWCDFVVKPGLLKGKDVDRYRIILTDSHQAEAVVDAFLVSEKRHAV